MHSCIPSCMKYGDNRSCIVYKPFPHQCHVHAMALMSTLGPVGAREVGNTRISPFISKPDTDPVKTAFSGLLLCEDYNIMACRICINRFWLVGGKIIILFFSHFYACIVVLKPWPWRPINTQTKYGTAFIRSAWVAPTSVNTLLESWTEILQKRLQSSYIPFALQVWYHIRASEKMHA